MNALIKSWANSIHALMLALALGVIAALTLLSTYIMFYINPAERPMLSVHELARIVRDEPVVRDVSDVETELTDTPPPAPAGEAERLLAHALARQLGKPPADVRVHLNQADRDRAPEIAREFELYGPSELANPLVLGTFEVAIRQPSGKWRLYSRTARNPSIIWVLTGRKVLVIGVLMVIPLSFWFSRRLTRPIRTFADAVRNLKSVDGEEPVPVTGPTEIRMAAEAINAMQARIARYVRERTSVVGAIAHDLRTPLARLEYHIAHLPPDVKKAAADEIREMEQLIGTTLDFVDNEIRPPAMEPLDLTTLVEGLVDDYADRNRDVQLARHEPITLVADTVLLKRIFTNLIDNALKYGERARIFVERHGLEALVRIEDDGPGLPPAQAARAFEPFFRGEASRNRGTGGVGLGLSIVQSAVEAHGGRVSLTNSADGGLVAQVVLPIHTSEAVQIV